MRIIKILFELLLGGLVVGSIALFVGYQYLSSNLPDVSELKEIRLQQPMQVLSADGELIALYGEKRRIPVAFKDIPPTLIEAIIATEDSRFYEHKGFDPVGILRAAFTALRSGSMSQGASTITQQVAKNFFLTPERRLTRKLREIILAVRIEHAFTKDEILELYLNKIYLGSRAYGVGAAAYTFFGKDLKDLNLSEIATLAGLPKAPTFYNPIYANKRATKRRNTVLWRMLELHYITPAEYEKTKNEPLIASYHEPAISFSAPYLTEMVRQYMFNKYGEHAYEDGYRVYTTIQKHYQLAANEAVTKNVIDYDMRHGYRGAEKVLWKGNEKAWQEPAIIAELKSYTPSASMLPAAVIAVNHSQATVLLADGDKKTIYLNGVRWARRYLNDKMQGPQPEKVDGVLAVGQLIWVRNVDQHWWLGQIPQVNSALVSLSPHDGAIQALVGGFDFNLSKFNRVTQSIRQVGSNIKPFIYAAALDKGLTLATILNDAPIVRTSAGSDAWRPKNSPETYWGPTRLKVGLATSKNVMMVRAVRAIGINPAADFLLRFGFPDKNIVRTESLALGAASFTPLQVARAYAVFVNGGYLVTPYYIDHIEKDDGTTVFKANPEIACPTCNVPVIYGQSDKSQLKSAEQLESEEIIDNLANTPEEPNEEQLSADIDQPAIVDTHPDAAETEETQTHYAPHVLSTDVAFLIREGLISNIWGEQGGHWLGTGWRARSLHRKDIGGKTGTTNLAKDAWYSGFGGDSVSTLWIGFDNYHRELGRSRRDALAENGMAAEGGAKSALPGWIDFMKTALHGVPEENVTPPKGIVSVMIDRDSGKLSNDPDALREYFIEGTEPKEHKVTEVNTTITDSDGRTYELF